MTSFDGEHIWIIGAGDGIGRAVAELLSAQGATLVLSGRDADKLEKLKVALGARHHAAPFDVSDAKAATDTAAVVFSIFPKLDRVIFMAGQYQPMPLDQLNLEATRSIVETNLLGPLNVVGAILPEMLRRKSGQIALCGSIAGYCGLPKSQPYGATKAGLINLTESLRAEVQHRGLDIRLLSPGFVRTRLTDKNSFKMPGIIEPDDAARRIAAGLRGRAFEIHFPHRLSLPLKLLSLLPHWLYFTLVRS